MGLMIHTLEGLNENYKRDYYIYLLDYGWHERLSDSLRKNFSKIADMSTKQKNTIVIMRTDEGVHFNDEVLSYHKINGDEVEEKQLLPAVLVTNRHPFEFKNAKPNDDNLKLVIFPLKKYCRTTLDVLKLIEEIFHNLEQKQDFNNFKITERKSKGINGAIAESLIIEPNFPDVAVSFNKLIEFLK